jgi:peptidoglycan hydrolase-like protein with peptidoglycan-binding domain
LHPLGIMKRLLFLLLLLPLGSLATGIHPEEDHPDPVGQASADPYTGFISQVQEKLRELGFDAGPVNGDFGTKTQAALAQFQLSRTIPAGGQLDDLTLEQLGVKRQQESAAAGATATEDGEAGDTGTGG